MSDNPLVVIIQGVKNQRPQRRFFIAPWGWNDLNNAFQYRFDIDAVFSRNQRSSTAIKTDDIFNLLLDLLGPGSWEIDFIDHRKDFKVMLQGKIYISQCLRLNTMRGVYDQNSAFAGSDAS